MLGMKGHGEMMQSLPFQDALVLVNGTARQVVSGNVFSLFM